MHFFSKTGENKFVNWLMPLTGFHKVVHADKGIEK